VRRGTESEQTSHQRLLPLVGGRNFRDLGGYETADGRKVRWQRLFRSGTLARLTAADQQFLGRLEVRTVCDLRTTSERASEPSSWMPDRGRVVTWNYELDDRAVMGAFRLGTPTPEGVRAAITEFYVTAPEDFAERLTTVFELLAADEAPLIMHCTAGKDRTGVATAVVLRALGVLPQTVVDDYALSDTLIDFHGLFGGESFQPSGSWAFLSTLPPDIRAPLMASEPAYLEAMLDTLDRQYGSFEGYLASRLGVTEAAIAHIRNLYLDR
jgi:protein-tyrosine phosphatase